MKKVYFVGIGPGDPELLTLKALKIIRSANLIIYPGSLISEEMLNFIQTENPQARYIDAYGMKLEEIIAHIERAIQTGERPVRLISGDPSLFSSLMEHIELLRERGISFEVIPGVSSAFAGASRLALELTYPDLSNSVIFTRIKGKTGGAEEEEILAYAKTKATLVFFLSTSLANNLSMVLQKVLPEDARVAVLANLTRKNEKLFLTTLKELPTKLKEEGITKTALIIVGKVLELLDKNFYKRSILYG